MKKHSQSVNKVAEESLHAFRHEKLFSGVSFQNIPHDNVFPYSIFHMSSADAHGQLVPEECALNIRGRATAFVLSILCRSQINPSMTLIAIVSTSVKKQQSKNPLPKNKNLCSLSQADLIIPLCRLCLNLGQIGQLCLPPILRWCCTSGSQRQPARCCSHELNSLYTGFLE